MSLTGLLVLLIIAGICGSIGRGIAGSPSGGGCLASIALGFIGALLGGWIAGQLNLPVLWAPRIGGQPFPVVWSIAGSALFVAVLTLLTGRRGGKR